MLRVVKWWEIDKLKIFFEILKVWVILSLMVAWIVFISKIHESMVIWSCNITFWRQIFGKTAFFCFFCFFDQNHQISTNVEFCDKSYYRSLVETLKYLVYKFYCRKTHFEDKKIFWIKKKNMKKKELFKPKKISKIFRKKKALESDQKKKKKCLLNKQ